MKKFLLIPALCAMCISCNTDSGRSNSNGNAQMQSDSTQPADWEITAKVKATIMKDNTLSNNARMISVSTEEGVVTLTGTAASTEEIRRVVKMVKDVPGVVKVDNQLTVAKS